MHIRFCVHPFKSGGFYCPQSCGASKIKPEWPSKLHVLGSHLLGAGPLDWGVSLVLLLEILCNIITLICALPTQGYGIWLYHESAPPTHLVVPSLHL